MVDEPFGNVCIEILAFDESEKELIHHLDVRPRHFQYWLVFLRIKRLTLGIDRWWYRSEKILAEHINYPRIHRLGDDLSIVCNVIQELVQSKSFDLFRLHITTGIVEIENNVALIDLLHKKLLPPIWRYFMETWKFLQLALPLI